MAYAALGRCAFSRAVYAINPSFSVFNSNLLCPHFNYCSTVWNDGCCSIIDKLFKLQKRAARVITGDTYDVRSTQTLDNLNWLLLEELLKQREIIMARHLKYYLVDHLDILKNCFQLVKMTITI